MIDPNTIATAASLFGISIKDLFQILQKFRKKLDIEAENERNASYIHAERQMTQYGLSSKLLIDFYENSTDNNNHIYSYTIAGKTIKAAVLTKQEWIGLRVITDNIKCNFNSGQAPVPSISKEDLAFYTAQVIQKQTSMKYKLWDSPSYRMIGLSVEKDEISLELGLGSFLQYRYTFGAARDELRQAFIDAGLNDIPNDDIIDKLLKDKMTSKILSNPDFYLECRTKLIPDCNFLIEFDKRLSIIGTNVVLAISRPRPYDDFALIIEKRSSFVSEGPGLIQLIPSGFHQPVIDAKGEMNPKHTIYRELYEELFGGEEAIHATRRIRHDWYTGTSEPMKYLESIQDSCILECVGVGVGLPSAVCELGFLFVIDHPDFWKNYSLEMQTNWEVVDDLQPVISTKDEETLNQTLTNEGWADSGRFTLAEALISLKEKYPQKVNVDLESLVGGNN